MSTLSYSQHVGITTSGWFEVEVFDVDGNYVIRRHVETIEEVEALLAEFAPVLS
jgi:hypothetical protein